MKISINISPGQASPEKAAALKEAEILKARKRKTGETFSPRSLKMQEQTQTMQPTQQVTCIIPFYNEGKRIFPVLEVVTQVPGISEIICVDDGSTDLTADAVQARWPQVRLLRLKKNGGKTAAIRHGLRLASHESILLMDADLQHLDRTELEHTLHSHRRHPAVDMIVMRRTNAPWSVKIDRGDILFSGERIIKKQDLTEILDQKVEGYQLEVAINQYMQQHKKNVRWVPWSATNTYKVKKCGLVKGLKRDFLMYADIVSFLGAGNFIRQLISFGRKPLESKEQYTLSRPDYPIGQPIQNYSEGRN